MEKQNSIITLSELVQKHFGENIETSVVSKRGPDHCPTITVRIQLPDGETLFADGANKRIAKQKAAEGALEYMRKLIKN